MIRGRYAVRWLHVRLFQCQIVEIRWQDHVWSTNVSSLTCLGPVLDPIVRRSTSRSLFGHPDFPKTHLPSKFCGVTSICHSVAFQTQVGGDVQAAFGTGGLTNSLGTTVHLPLTSGDEPSRVDWTLGGDATVLDDYAIATTTMTTMCLAA